MRIAIQGIKGSYHHQVATILFGNQKLSECSTFDELAVLVSTGQVDCGIMAIGNSIAGSILPNYALIQSEALAITAEHYLNINHQLMCLKGQDIHSIHEVQSHPMALLQCRDFFRKHPRIRAVETDDTAAAAQRIAQNGQKGVAAIASAQAAQMYGLDIIEKRIQQVRNNATRFVVLERQPRTVQGANKATINFTASHQPGSLGRILNTLGDLGVNLSKIQSIPIVDKPFLYSFVADLEFEDLAQFEVAQLEIGILVESMNILGIYKAEQL
ncbi:prephenate dehydratase [Nonlabens xiamenensis]|uniref:prephenate dehydratase n=1 Tax=Nonlabens xiamenensis TaxID=2341043 RepID=UPI000F609655|nr:prephenate dehydratase [Nonlabens xiamenensis]